MSKRGSTEEFMEIYSQLDWFSRLIMGAALKALASKDRPCEEIFANCDALLARHKRGEYISIAELQAV